MYDRRTNGVATARTFAGIATASAISRRRTAYDLNLSIDEFLQDCVFFCQRSFLRQERQAHASISFIVFFRQLGPVRNFENSSLLLSNHSTAGVQPGIALCGWTGGEKMKT